MQLLSKYRLFTYFGLFWVFLCFLAVFLAMTGIFYKEIILAYMIFAGGFLFFVFLKNYQTIYQNMIFFPAFLISVIFIVVLSQNITPTVFSGRDQGSLSEAAIRLSQNHNLYSSSLTIGEFYKIYGPGQALNFPGFNYTSDQKLVTHFPLGYISWLAVFYSLFGLEGLTIANGVTFLFFLMCLLLVARMYLSSTLANWTWLLAISSFLFSWFFKFTLSENLALMLFWFGLWEFLLFTRRRKRLYLISAFFTFIILAFARIEALAMIPIMLLVIGFKYKHQDVTEKSVFKSWMIIPTVLALVIFILSFRINQPFYINLAKGFIDSFTREQAQEQESVSYLSSFFYLIKVLGLYAILNYLIAGLLGILYLIKNKRYTVLVPFLISLPVWIYLINPSISQDHPWMLRRFVFIIFPMAILYSVIFLERFFVRKIYIYSIIIIFFIANLFVTFRYFSFSENKNLLAQINEIGRNFSPNDLILVDREATGDGWTMMTGPLNFLYGKQAVYFINPSDLSKIDTKRFSNVFFIIPNKNEEFYSSLRNNLIFRREYRIELSELDIKTGKKQEVADSPVNLPREKTIVTYGKIYQLSNF